MVVMDVERMAVTAPGRVGARHVPGRPLVGVPSAPPVPGQVSDRPWRPLAGPALLDRLRVTGRRRQVVTPELVDRLRVALEGRLGDDRVDGELHAPVVVTKDRLTRILACDDHQLPAGADLCTPTIGMACGALVDALFRQFVTVGRLGDAMDDGMAALAVDDHHRALVEWIGRLPGSQLADLEAEVGRQARGIETRWPALDARWLPRTQESMRVPLLGGTVELAAKVDLAVGAPAVGESSVALVDVKSGMPRPEHRPDLHFYALVETIRTGAPPFAVATYYTRTGELDVEPVTGSLLFGAAHRTAAGTRLLRQQARGIEQSHRSGALCVRCEAMPYGDDRSVGVRGAGEPGPSEPATTVILASERSAA